MGERARDVVADVRVYGLRGRRTRSRGTIHAAIAHCEAARGGIDPDERIGKLRGLVLSSVLPVELWACFSATAAVFAVAIADCDHSTPG